MRVLKNKATGLNNEEVLINACKNNRRDAQKMLFDKYCDRIFQVCKRYIHDHHEAEDVMMIAFTRVFRYIKNYENQGEGGIIRWIKTIAVNECLRFIRKKRNLELVDDFSLLDQPVEEKDLEAMDGKQIIALVQKLPLGYRTVFNLYVLDGFTHEEIAGKLGISAGTSKSQLSKARKLLQQFIQQQSGYESA